MENIKIDGLISLNFIINNNNYLTFLYRNVIFY